MRDWAWRGPERRAYTRREWVSATAASVLITPLTESAGATGAVPSQQPASAPLPLTQFQPKSMLHVGETRVQRARFPVIDFHTHVSRRRAQKPGVPPGELVKTMDAVNLHTMVNLTGGAGDDLAGAIAGFDQAFPRRFVSMTEPSWTRAGETGYAAWQADEIGRAKAAGAVGVKVLKTLGLYLRDGGASGKLVRVDDAAVRSDVGGVRPARPAGGDPRRRSGSVLPADRSLQRTLRGAQRAPRLVVPRQGLSGVQGDSRGARSGLRAPSEDHVRGAARRALGGEPGRRSAKCSTSSRTSTSRLARASASWAASRARRRGSSIRYQDRILFGTDAVPLGIETPQQVFGEDLYRIYYRFLETEDEYFDYAPAPVPPQGRWRIYGLGLRESILRKVYSQNAERVLGRKLVTA